MNDVINLLTSVELWVTILGAGGLLKLVEWIVKRYFTRDELKLSLQTSEKDSLRKDIEYLRGEVEKLRKEVSSLKTLLDDRDKEINKWQRRYWEVSAALDRLIIFLRYNASEASRAEAMPIIRAMENSGIVESDDEDGLVE